MNAERQKTVAFAVCGSFCTLGAAVPQAARLAAEGWRVLPVMSFAAAGTDTRFGSAAGWKARLAAAAGHEVLDTLAAKSLLRVGCPVVVAVSTNDGLSGSGENMARLMQRKGYYFVPYGQDDPQNKPHSLKADLELVSETLSQALDGRQIQPVLLQRPLSPH